MNERMGGRGLTVCTQAGQNSCSGSTPSRSSSRARRPSGPRGPSKLPLRCERGGVHLPTTTLPYLPTYLPTRKIFPPRLRAYDPSLRVERLAALRHIYVSRHRACMIRAFSAPEDFPAPQLSDARSYFGEPKERESYICFGNGHLVCTSITGCSVLCYERDRDGRSQAQRSVVGVHTLVTFSGDTFDTRYVKSLG